MNVQEIPNSDDWLAAQQKYWDIWLDLTRHTMGDTPTDNMPGVWAESMRKWWETASPMAPPMAQEFFRRMLWLSQSYLEIAERFSRIDMHQPGVGVDNWLDNLKHTFATFSEGTSSHSGGMPDAFAFWDLPLDTWRRTMSSMLPIPGDSLQALQQEDAARVATRFKERLDRFLSTPAVGYSREAQDQYQRLMRLVLDYVATLQEYTTAFAGVGFRSTELLYKKLSVQSSPVDSLRKLYDLWVDAWEEVYAEYVMSEEYALLYGRMVNALMAVKHHGSLLVDEVVEAMNMPTRREINTMHRHIHEARRENRILRAELDLIKDPLESNADAPIVQQR